MSLRSTTTRLLFAQHSRARMLRACAFAVLTCTIAWSLGTLPSVRLLELKMEDVRYRLRGERTVDDRILVIEIDDETRNAYPRFPLTRDQYASLTFFAERFGAAGVVFDLFFTDADSASTADRLWAQALELLPGRATLAAHLVDPRYRERSSGRTIEPQPLGSIAVEPSDAPVLALTTDRIDGPAPAFAAAPVAHATVLESIDGSVRRVPILARAGAHLYPSLALAAWLELHDLEPQDVVLHAPTLELRGRDGRTLLRSTPGLVAEIDYAGGMQTQAPRRLGFVQAMRILKAANAPGATEEAKEEARATFGGHVLLVGLTAGNSYMVDFGVTPFDSSAPLLFAHVNLLDTLLRDRRIVRPHALYELVLTGLLAWLGTWWAGTLRPSRLLLVLIAVVLTLVIGWQVAFTEFSIRFNSVAHLAALLLCYVTVGSFAYLGQEQERQILRRTFEQYVSPDLLAGIVANAGRIDLGGDSREVTVLFLDIRGFTAWSRSVPAAQLVGELNAFLAEMVDVIFEHDGAVNKFLGDAVLAVFGAPIQRSDDARRAVVAALAMRMRLQAHNAARSHAGVEPLRIGIGIATGTVVAGNVGSRRRLEYTVIGDPVNLASRLQSLSKDGQILLDRRTRDLLDEAHVPIGAVACGTPELKGIGQVEVYELASTASSPAPR
jgi:adenylate cyclase